MAKNKNGLHPVIKTIRDRWTNRRWMTWIVVLMTIGIAYRMFFMPGADVLLAVFTTWLTFTTAFTGYYFGFSTYDDVKGRPDDKIHGSDDHPEDQNPDDGKKDDAPDNNADNTDMPGSK